MGCSSSCDSVRFQVRAHVHDGEASRFAAQQLLQLVPCLDLADGVGHHAAISLVQELLRQPPGPGSYACGGDESLERAVVSAAKHVHADDRQLQQALLRCILVAHSQLLIMGSRLGLLFPFNSPSTSSGFDRSD
jgi:hypothetical protein